MTKKTAFKAMNKAIGFSDDAATELTDTEVVDSMPKLSRITYARAYKICKAIRSLGGAGAGVHVTEGAEHNLVIAAAIVLNAPRVLRTIECAEIRFPCQIFLTSIRISKCWKYSGSTKNGRTHSGPCQKMAPKNGWKVLREDFHDHTNTVRGAVTKATIAYLTRNRLILLPPFFSDTMEAGVVSIHQNKYAQAYCTHYGWSRVNPMRLKKHAHETLCIIFKQDGVPPKIVLENSK